MRLKCYKIIDYEIIDNNLNLITDFKSIAKISVISNKHKINFVIKK